MIAAHNRIVVLRHAHVVVTPSRATHRLSAIAFSNVAISSPHSRHPRANVAAGRRRRCFSSRRGDGSHPIIGVLVVFQVPCISSRSSPASSLRAAIHPLQPDVISLMAVAGLHLVVVPSLFLHPALILPAGCAVCPRRRNARAVPHTPCRTRPMSKLSRFM